MTYTQSIHNDAENREPILGIWRKINEREEQREQSVSMDQPENPDESLSPTSPQSN